MLTSIDKALVAAIMAVLTVAEQVWGFSLGLTEEWWTMLIAVVSPILVWFIPNRPA